MQNNMRTIHVGIFHSKIEIRRISISFLISAISEGSGDSVHFRKFDLALKFEKKQISIFFLI